jgi:hypothetical protein
MSFRLPISLGQVLRHANTTPLKHPIISARFISHQTQSIRSPIPISTLTSIRFPTPPRRPLMMTSYGSSTPHSASPFSILRSFSTTRQTLMRPNYFPRNSGSGRGTTGGGSSKPGFFRRMLISIERLPHTYIVRHSLRFIRANGMIDIRPPRSKHCNLLPMGIRKNLLSAIQRSIIISIHGPEFLDQ